MKRPRIDPNWALLAGSPGHIPPPGPKVMKSPVVESEIVTPPFAMHLIVSEFQTWTVGKNAPVHVVSVPPPPPEEPQPTAPVVEESSAARRASRVTWVAGR